MVTNDGGGVRRACVVTVARGRRVHDPVDSAIPRRPLLDLPG